MRGCHPRQTGDSSVITTTAGPDAPERQAPDRWAGRPRRWLSTARGCPDTYAAPRCSAAERRRAATTLHCCNTRLPPARTTGPHGCFRAPPLVRADDRSVPTPVAIPASAIRDGRGVADSQRPGDRSATLAIVRAPAANPQNDGSRSHSLKLSLPCSSPNPRLYVGQPRGRSSCDERELREGEARLIWMRRLRSHMTEIGLSHIGETSH